MQIKPKNHSIDSLFAFLLLLIFCLFTLMLAGMGSTIYRNGTAYLNENYTSRTAVAYVAEKVRQHDDAGSVLLSGIPAVPDEASVSVEAQETEELSASGETDAAGEIPTLVLRDTIEGEDFLTYVYFYDGALCELMIQADRTPDPAMGTRVVELSSLTIEAVPKTDLLSVTAVGEEGSELSELVHVSGNLEELYEKK